MKQTDRYGILKKSTELLGKMDLGIADQRSKGLSLDVSLEMVYKTTETALLAHVRQQVAQIKSIAELTDCFVDTCYGFGALGMRQDLMRRKLLGASKSGQEALCEAIEKDTQSKPVWECGLPFSEGELEYLNAYNLSNEAYTSYAYIIPNDSDKRALTFIYLLHYMQEHSVDLDLTVAAVDLQYASCLKVITNKNWANRSLAGYFGEDGTYNNADAEPELLSIFGEALKELIDKSKDYFEALQIKQYLHKLLIKVYAGSNGASPLELYVEIEKLMTASKTTKGITAEDVEDAIYSSTFAVTKKYEVSGLTYELNTKALQSLAELSESLGLGGLQEINAYIGKIKSYTCA